MIRKFQATSQVTSAMAGFIKDIIAKIETDDNPVRIYVGIEQEKILFKPVGVDNYEEPLGWNTINTFLYKATGDLSERFSSAEDLKKYSFRTDGEKNAAATQEKTPKDELEHKIKVFKGALEDEGYKDEGHGLKITFKLERGKYETIEGILHYISNVSKTVEFLPRTQTELLH